MSTTPSTESTTSADVVPLSQVKEAFFKQVVALALTKGCTPYGGHPRDTVRGDEFNDIDIACSSEKTMHGLINLLRSLFTLSDLSGVGSEYASKSYLVSSKQFSGVEIKIDLTVKKLGDNLDFDVNALCLDSDRSMRIFALEEDVPLSILELCAKINRKEFSIVPSAIKQIPQKPSDMATKAGRTVLLNQIKLRQRVCKMLTRGWTCLNTQEAFGTTLLFTSHGSDKCSDKCSDVSDIKCPMEGCELKTVSGDYMFLTACCQTSIHFECIHSHVEKVYEMHEVKCPECGLNKFW